ncbi:isochorismatase family protein [Streptomyces sp. H27-S2]|uniref:isochorismatase family protein n=1 Tax=Streptomyces antarcticus TaxID=2996458 RepID=UPI002D1E364D|nr:isochorismatase family protein [Streptomyces sp. H27-S2]
MHDMQNYFLRAFAQTGPAGPATANIRRLLTACRQAGVPVIYTAQPSSQPASARGLLVDFWGPGLGGRPDDDQITAPLAPTPGDTVVTKHRYSAFHGTDLDDVLAARGRDQMLITGVYAHLGCLLTATDAFARGVQPFLVADAMADFDKERHWQALRYAADCCAGVTVTDEVLRLSARPEPRTGPALISGHP